MCFYVFFYLQATVHKNLLLFIALYLLIIIIHLNAALDVNVFANIKVSIYGILLVTQQILVHNNKTKSATAN